VSFDDLFILRTAVILCMVKPYSSFFIKLHPLHKKT
jgi:hypothetical protein